MTKYSVHRPMRGTGNAGMTTPYEDGYRSGANGEEYDNPYNQPGEEVEMKDYESGWKRGNAEGLKG